MSKLFFAVAALAAALPSVSVSASVPRAAGTRVVAYGDLDLSAPAGRAQLERRIGAAVRELCGNAASGDLAGASAVRACQAATLAQTVRPTAGGTQ